MLLVLGDIILFTFRIIFTLLKFIIKAIVKTLTFILTKPFLRFPFLLFTIGFFLHIKFNTLATIYFLYLVNICAIKFKIYEKIYIDLSYLFDTIFNSYKVSHNLRALKNDSIILNNIHLENNDEDSCLIDDLVITNSGVFAIKTLTYPYTDFTKNKYSNEITFDNEDLNDDTILDNNVLNKIYDECTNCYNILQDILSSDIPITNIIALPQKSLVIKQNEVLDTPIVTAEDLPYFIKNKINKDSTYSPLKIKETVLQNKSWSFDILLDKLLSFLNHSKFIILFISLFIITYYIYITFVTYIFFKFVSL